MKLISLGLALTLTVSTHFIYSISFSPDTSPELVDQLTRKWLEAQGAFGAIDNLWERVQRLPGLSTFVAAVKAADLQDMLINTGGSTVFAPNNEAFEKLGTVGTDLLKPENKEKLRAILKNHILNQAIYNDSFIAGSYQNLNNQDLSITSVIKVNNATVTESNVTANNGNIFVIDTVLIP
jgi:uncharacterized surface protein with fasciclin (FAS1) repeats